MPVCANCGQETPEGFPRCANCGSLLEVALPSVSEERKVVSVLFCDLVGFTAASDTADPEDVRARIRPYHQRLREVIERFGGTVEKYVGDAVMAVFGAPVAHEDDPERAVRAGLRILEAIEELNAQDASLSLQVRVGINTGEAVVALGARPKEGEGIVTGDVVNTASRLQGAAPVNGVAVSEATYRATERIFDFEPLEPVTVKGKSEPLVLYHPVAARARFGSEVTRSHATPLVGRELEKPLLIGTFERAAQQQSCQLVTVVGEPGVGKSRLCMELFQYIEERPGLVTWRQGRCLPYGEGIAFWALGEIVKAECGILESDSPELVREKLERVVSEDAPDRPWLLARLGPLVGIIGEPAAQEESFTAWRRFLEGLAAGGPAVLVFEDLHWADPALLAFLEHLADWAEGVPLLVLCTARPELHEQHTTWAAGLRNATMINLAPLTDEETARLVSSLLERAVLPAETHQALLERAGGNPLYAEEFVRLLADRGGHEGEMEVPESVQALIAARLDTLTPERKGLLQDAAVMGKVFWAGALAVMGERDLGEVEQALHELARKELVRPSRTSSMAAEAEYGFWHTLVRDVCYGQIPRTSRAERHQQAAAWIEQKAGERAEDLADVLAYHYLAALELTQAAGLPDNLQLRAQAVRYLGLAGDRSMSLDVAAAERHLARALELAPSGSRERAALLERWASALLQQSRHREAKEALDEAAAVYRELDDSVAVGRVLTQFALVLARAGEAGSEDAIREAVVLLESQPAGVELVNAYARLASNRAVGSASAEAGAAAERAMGLAVELGLSVPAMALGSRGLARCTLGEREGVDDMREALGLALAHGDSHTAATMYNNLAGAVDAFEGLSASVDTLTEGIDFARRRGILEKVLSMTANRLLLLADLGQTERTLSEIGPIASQLEANQSISFVVARSLQLRLLVECGQHNELFDPAELIAAARRSGVLQHSAAVLDSAAAVFLARGKPARARELLTELDQLEGTRGDPMYIDALPRLVRTALALHDRKLADHLVDGVRPTTPVAVRSLAACRAQLTEAAGEHETAASLYAETAERWYQLGVVPERAYALLGQGRCLQALGNPGAEQPLTQARELFQSIGYKPALVETEVLLAESEPAAS